MKNSMSTSSVSLWRLVIIEDSPEDCDEIRRLLLQGSDRRYQFVEAETGAAGVRAILDPSNGPPDCVVLDYTLPDTDAMEVLRAVIDSDGLTVCPVVVLTGTAGPQFGPALLRAGAQDFIGKSWMTAESLTRAVDNAAERWAMIRELQAHAAALHFSEAQLQLAVEVAGLGVTRIDYVTNTVILDTLAAALFGLVAEESLPRSVIHATFYPDDKDEIFRLMNQSLDPRGNGCFVMEHRVVHADGSIRWLSVKKQVVFGDVGGIRRPLTGVLAAVDITERKVAEAELRKRNEQLAEAEARIRSVVNNVIYGIITIDEWGVVESFNSAAEQLFGYKPEEVLGQNVKMLMGEPHNSQHDDYLANYKRTGQAKIIGIGREVEGRRKDGSTFLMDLGISKFLRGERNCFTGVVRDITERKQAEEALRESEKKLRDADRTKDEFLATLAHELRNPLAPVRNSLELLKWGSGNAELQKQARETMERQIAHMVRLIDDLLDVSRISRNKLELKNERVELTSVIHHSVEACQPHFVRDKHEFVLTLPPEPIHLHGDPTRLAQVIGNLLSNACKYSTPGGKIWLTVERQIGEVKIVIRDTGIGIPPEMLDKVFVMFTQIDKSLERSDGGLGIGLSLVKRLVELHGGTVTAHSEGLGQGSEFTVRLPVEIDQPRIESPIQQLAAAPARSAGRRILVVDDNHDSATSLALLLKMTGHQTKTAFDGLAALETAEAFRPEVILLDIGLPKMNGHDTCRAIRDKSWGKDILILALTGWGQEEDRRKTTEAGFDSHLVKPVDHVALNKLVSDSKPRQEAVR